jgi:Flp pilus assembly pilin Flp
MNSITTLAFQLRRAAAAEQGQTLVEYALLIALMSIALTAVLFNFSTGVDGLYGVIRTVVDTIGGS